jgi:plasmid stability protein
MGLRVLIPTLAADTILLERGSMATQNSIHVSDELLAELQVKAAAAGKAVDELAEDVLRKGLEERAWQELAAYGRERGRLAGFTEEQSADVVHEWRKDQRR